MPETTPLIKAALNLRVGAGFDVYVFSTYCIDSKITPYQPSENLLYEKKYYREKRL